MDNDQLIIMWAMFVGITLILDIGLYFVQRDEWKKSGVLLTEKFWGLISDKPGQFFEAAWKTLRPVKRQLVPAPAIAPVPAPVVDDTPVEIIPVSVKMVGGEMRRVEFVVDMALNSKVNVRIGATREAGVKVEKREM